MTNPERVHAFLTGHPGQPFCDDCLSKETDVRPRQTINTIASTLGLTSDFERGRNDLHCSLCRDFKVVTRSLRQP